MASSAPHRVLLEFEYESPDRARLVERCVRQEVGEIAGDRTRATVRRDGATLAVDVVADDLVALRAGLNTWCTLVEVAEGLSEPRRDGAREPSEDTA
ncbi:KEOPS complex subunit Pcc1 [Halomarina ordinaria]|uniref:KEOPS complex subunit Pcc1 n=1 Tax=Halomarina ordinaria TaxID=3033939 RepID=A0ABD5U7M8_9EURY|nr:KEOPS complex subunit Pcc1 [Halomarina sp. PSRA2]